MNLETLRAFLMWCSILNGGLLILSSLLLVFTGDWVYKIHSRWFPMPRETFNAVIYAFIGFYKILFITLFLVPWLALVILSCPAC